ncbi:MAG: UDP-2,4-diacetamido-2,4,6-trideoxy-beta-L-altropyranose hydrolase [Lachnospiraceae bacterium]|nr:UDP-2,4-diacetamido-2,4,6-trideoxy-beta-L-altropyranose hydrolase [Lachnospiraceae bacterium]
MFFIRADGNAKIGAGHLMRCMAVGEELALSVGREEIYFLCADTQSAALAKDHGFQTFVLGTDYQNMESELPLWRELTEKLSAEKGAGAGRLVILIDSYYVTEPYLEALGRIGHTVLMDDFGTHCYPVDCIINYNAPAEVGAYRELYRGKDTRLLIGCDYIPLRRQFRAAEQVPCEKAFGIWEQLQTEKEVGIVSEKGCKIRETARKVLITTGGGDSENIAEKILKKLYESYLEFHLVIGQFSPHFQEMKELEKTYANIYIHYNVENMAALMKNCDIALTAAGSTVYELAAVGVPMICFSYAQNQEMLAEYMGREHIAGYAGPWHKNWEETLERMENVFQNLIADNRLRVEYSMRERAMVDGYGAERIARMLTEFVQKD